MSSEDNGAISRENLSTVSAVGFIVALLALSLAIWGWLDVRRLAAATGTVHERSMTSTQTIGEQGKQIKELEARLAAVEAKLAAAEAAPAEAAAATP